jgi:hypothetical protein
LTIAQPTCKLGKIANLGGLVRLRVLSAEFSGEFADDTGGLLFLFVGGLAH